MRQRAQVPGPRVARPREEREDSAPTLREQLEDAKAAFVDADARTAYAKAFDVLHAVDATLSRLEESRDETRDARIESFLRLRELDAAVLETSSLCDLLQLVSGREVERGAASAQRTLDAVFARLTDYLESREREPVRGEVAHPTLRMRRMRTLLHAVDADGTHLEERTAELRDRRLRTARVLLGRVRDDQPSPLRRVVCAALARACDAILREEIGELSDVLIAAASEIRSEHDLAVVAEATMVPEAGAAFRAYASLIERTERTARVTEARALTGLEALFQLVQHLPGTASPRQNALRAALLEYAEVVSTIEESGSLAELSGFLDGTTSSITQLANAASSLARLVVGARRRLGDPDHPVVGVDADQHVVGDVHLAAGELQRLDVGDPERDRLDRGDLHGVLSSWGRGAGRRSRAGRGRRARPSRGTTARRPARPARGRWSRRRRRRGTPRP